MSNNERQAGTNAQQSTNAELTTSAPLAATPLLAAVDAKVAELLKITDEFIFPAYYSHTGKTMWKIENIYTKWGGETLVLCPLDEGIEKALDLAIEHISKRREKYYAAVQ